MGVWKKSPQVDPAIVARLQAQVDADPTVRRFRSGEGWDRERGGRVSNARQLSDYVRSRYPLPDGYDVGQNGDIVYTNKTPALQQAAWAALPIAAVTGVGAVANAMAPAAATTTINAAGMPSMPGYAGAMAPGSAPGSAPLLGRVAKDVANGARRVVRGGGDDLLDKILQYLPIGIAGGSALMGLRNQEKSPYEDQLKGLIDTAQRRTEGAEPLYQALNAMAMDDVGRVQQKRGSADAIFDQLAAQDDAGLAQRRRAVADPLLESLSKMAGGQMPRYTREG